MFSPTLRPLPRLMFLLLVGCAVSVGWRAHPRAFGQGQPAARIVTSLDADWRFSRGDFAAAMLPAFDDAAWRSVDLPHDWSAEGPFSADYASGTGYAPGGVAWYRKRFTLPAELAGKVAVVEFDGVYDNAQVWVNGQLACGRPYGYASFECPLTPFASFGGNNVLAVRVDHSKFADSRWYTGSGIYRHVRLRVTDALHVAQWGTAVTTPAVSAREALVRVETTVENGSDRPRSFVVETDVVDGTAAAATSRTDAVLQPGERRAIVQDLRVMSPRRWSLESPALYRLAQRLREGTDVVDQVETAFGIRTIRFDAGEGFFLNDAPVKLKGVCLHHDAGSVGAAVPEPVWQRRLRALKDLGVNAIRTSHNPPAPEFLDECDRLGLLVMDEAFDEFTPPKNKWVKGWNAGLPSRFGYGEVFAEWADRDVGDMVRRDRNHPSIVMWSIGNEVDYPNDPFSHPVLGRDYRPGNPPASNLVALARPLVDEVRKLDPSRPVSAALASLEMSDAVGLPALLDVVGYNYQESRYADDHRRYPARVILGSENNYRYSNWTVVRDHPYVAGQFLWTGIDYLGEAGAFPNRANGAGLLDLCGFRKPGGWLRKSLWSDTPMVYLAASRSVPDPERAARVEEHWNWPSGSTLAVVCYSNCQEVTLTLNGKPIGQRRPAEAPNATPTWEVPYAEGVLEAVGRVNGKQAAVFALKTAGPPARIELVPDVAKPPSARETLWQIEFRIVDAQGVRVPNADSLVTFRLDGPVRALGIGNADLNSTEDCKDLLHHAYQGRGLAILQATGAGAITLSASSPGLQPAAISFATSNRRFEP